MLSNSGHDEHGRYTGGKAGDQTGTEWQVIPFYSYPWNVVLEPPTPRIGEEIALLARHAAANDHIGYDQSERLTFDTALRKTAHNDPAEITNDVESDCSAGVAAIVRAVGRRLGISAMADVSASCWTGNLKAALVKAGFKARTASKYLTSDAYLGKGWILLNESNHTAINVSYGSKYAWSYKKPNFRRILRGLTYIRSKRVKSKFYRVGSYAKGKSPRISGISKGNKYWWGTLANGRGYIYLGTVADGIKYVLPNDKWLRRNRYYISSNHIKKLKKGSTVTLVRIIKGSKYFWGEVKGGGYIRL